LPQPPAVPDIPEIATRHFFFDPVFRAYTRRLQKIRGQKPAGFSSWHPLSHKSSDLISD
jgi:hypothetical protein